MNEALTWSVLAAAFATMVGVLGFLARVVDALTRRSLGDQ
jgi:hypothetical protein